MRQGEQTDYSRRMRSGRRRVSASLAALAIAVLPGGVAACAASPPGPSLVLTFASPDLSTDPNAPLVQHFSDEVARLSQNAIRIEPAWDVTPPGINQWNQEVAAFVAQGTYDLGLVPSDAFDVLGVDSLQALTAPFLIESSDLLRAVLDGTHRQQLMAGLADAGVVGVDLFPAQFMHPFGFDSPLLGIADYQGRMIQASSSTATASLLHAFGATATDEEVGTAEMRGQQSGYAWVVAGVATGNVTFSPKVETLIIDAHVWERLRPDQWEILTQAAADTRMWAFENLPSELESAAEFCRAGGRIVAATAAQRDELMDAASTVMTRLRADDAETAALIDAIMGLKATHPAPDDMNSCPTLGELPGEAQASALNGTYHFVASADALRAAGVVERLVDENAGDYTIALKDGRWSAAQVYETGPKRGSTWHGSGTYAVDDGVLTFAWPVGFENDQTTAVVTMEADGALRFTEVTEGRGGEWSPMGPVIFARWERIGIAP